jgi:hypothetical protein
MKNRVCATSIASAASLAGVVCLIGAPAIAQTCVPLAVVDGQGTQQIQKSVSPPGTGVTRDNWSTDFVVPSSQSFRRYVARILPENGGEYQVLVALKYNNDTADTVFNRTVELPQNRFYGIQGSARANATPYQVNVKVGGVKAIGNRYRVSALGCY